MSRRHAHRWGVILTGLAVHAVRVPGAVRASAWRMLPLMMVAGLLSGVRGLSFSVSNLVDEAPPVLITLGIGWASGAVVAPLLYPWLPGQGSAFKGGMAGGLGLLAWPAACGWLHLRPWDVATALCVIPSMASWLALAYGGAWLTGPSCTRAEDGGIAIWMARGGCVAGAVLWMIPRFVPA